MMALFRFPPVTGSRRAAPNRRVRGRGVIALLAVLLATATVHAQDHLPLYTLKVRLDPAAGRIEVAGRLDHACVGDSVRLYLNKAFQIEEFRDSAGPMSVRFDTASSPLPYTDVTRRLVTERRACTISFRYRGVVADTLMNVNIISPALVELASYSGWYFESPDFKQVKFDVTVTLPAEFTVTGNGREISSSKTSGYRSVRLRDAAPGFDIVLVAATGFRTTRRTLGSVAVTTYSPAADSAADERTLADLLGALRRYESWYGSAASAGTLNIVDSPRGGWGYSRIPLIINSARHRDRQLLQPLGRMRVMQGAAHELAHFWWSIADVGTGDDWINEGLAEYSAFSAATAEFGQPARDSLLAQYRQDAAQSQTDATIVATAADSRDRYVNRYEKPVLLLAELEQTYGRERVHRALREVYARFHGTRAATTAAVLTIFGQVLSPDAAARLKVCVVDVAWHERCP